jgi:hypothetical protein
MNSVYSPLPRGARELTDNLRTSRLSPVHEQVAETMVEVHTRHLIVRLAADIHRELHLLRL